MADIMKLLQQAQEMQGRMQQMQGELEQKTVTGAAGGGMVTVEATGRGRSARSRSTPRS
jgi:DNA-binding protein YbaB